MPVPRHLSKGHSPLGRSNGQRILLEQLVTQMSDVKRLYDVAAWPSLQQVIEHI
jgi:hypothetical protein